MAGVAAPRSDARGTYVRSILSLGAAAAVSLPFALLMKQILALAIVLIVLALVAYTVGMPTPRDGVRFWARIDRAVTIAVLVFALVGVATATHRTLRDAGVWHWSVGWILIIAVGVSVTAVVATHGASARWYAAALVACAVVFVAVATATRIDRGVENILDVTLFHVGASNALIEGTNPYSITFEAPDPDSAYLYYGDEVLNGTTLEIGYPYPPLSLLLVVPFQWFLGDYRLGLALALVASAVIIRGFDPGPRGRVVAVLFLISIPGVRMVVHGWSEPLLIVLFLAVILAHLRRQSIRPYAMGLLLAIKQYTVLFLPSYLLLTGRPGSLRNLIREGLRILAVVIVLAVPFAAADPGGFYRSVIAFQFRQPFRPDSISVLAQLNFSGATPAWPLLLLPPFLMAAAASVYVFRRAEEGPQGFSLGSALIMLAWVVFAKQAFTNYYFVVAGMLFAAAALGIPCSEASLQGADSEHRSLGSDDST